MSGAFVAVVGASGVGKDSVIDEARRVLEAEDGFTFPRRRITRPGGPGEDHEPIGDEEFARLAGDGGFALSWRAHGLAYGVTVAAVHAVRDGEIVVANVSRGVLEELSERFGRSAIVRVYVSDEVRRARIARRGRETDAALQARMDRADPAPGCRVDLEIRNDGTIEEAGQALAEFLRTLV